MIVEIDLQQYGRRRGWKMEGGQLGRHAIYALQI